MLSRRWLLAAGLAPAPAVLAGAAAAAAGAAGNGALLLGDRDELTAATPAASVESVILAGYRAPGDGSRAQYRRANVEPKHPGKLRSADGAWWELCEHSPTPEMFGADGTYDGDTAGLQACCDYVRANVVFTINGGEKRGEAVLDASGAVHLNARPYYINRSIDFTDKGRKVGLGIVGCGKFVSIIYAKLTEPYPVLDMAGVYYARVSGITISCEPGDLSSCCLLLAQVLDTEQHNNVPTIADCLFASDSPNLAATLVIQGADLCRVQNCEVRSRTGPACSYGTGLPALYHGYAVAAGSSTQSAQLNVSGVYDNSPVGLGPHLVGKSVVIDLAGSPFEIGAIRTIAAYDPLTHTIHWAAPLDHAPTGAARVTILALTSKFQTLSNVPDNTLATFINSNFAGVSALQLRSMADFCAIGCYFTSIEHGSDGVVVMDDYMFSQTEHVVRLIGGCRWENEAANISAIGFLSYNQIALLDIEGVISIGAKNGAQIGSALGGRIQNLHYRGAADNVTPLFKMLDAAGKPAPIEGFVSGSAKFVKVGVVGPVGRWSLDSTPYGAPLEDVAAVAGPGSYQGTPLIGRHARLQGVTGFVSQVLELQGFDPQVKATTGARSQARLTWTIPGRALDTSDSHVKRRFHGEFMGGCRAQTAFGVALTQADPASASQTEGATLASGAPWRLVLDISRNGRAWVWSGQLWSGTTLVHSFQGTLPAFDETGDIQIEISEDAATGNALSATTYSGQLS